MQDHRNEKIKTLKKLSIQVEIQKFLLMQLKTILKFVYKSLCAQLIIGANRDELQLETIVVKER